jgi:hypothetical protein
LSLDGNNDDSDATDDNKSNETRPQKATTTTATTMPVVLTVCHHKIVTGWHLCRAQRHFALCRIGIHQFDMPQIQLA